VSKELVERLRNSGITPSLITVRAAADAIEALMAERDSTAELLAYAVKERDKYYEALIALRAQVEELRKDASNLRDLLKEANPYLKNTDWGMPGIDLPYRIDAAIAGSKP